MVESHHYRQPPSHLRRRSMPIRRVHSMRSKDLAAVILSLSPRRARPRWMKVVADQGLAPPCSDVSKQELAQSRDGFLFSAAASPILSRTSSQRPKDLESALGLIPSCRIECAIPSDVIPREPPTGASCRAEAWRRSRDLKRRTRHSRPCRVRGSRSLSRRQSPARVQGWRGGSFGMTSSFCTINSGIRYQAAEARPHPRLAVCGHTLAVTIDTRDGASNPSVRFA